MASPTGMTPQASHGPTSAMAEGPGVQVLERPRTDLAPLSAVVCHDDPHTTFEFVIQVLRGVFRLPQARAVELTIRVDAAGAAVIGRYPKEVAERKVQRATALARANAYPLTFSVESDD